MWMSDQAAIFIEDKTFDQYNLLDYMKSTRKSLVQALGNKLIQTGFNEW